MAGVGEKAGELVVVEKRELTDATPTLKVGR